MSRHVVVNVVLALIALSLVGGVVYLEATNRETPATTTTSTSTTTTTTLPPTTLPPTTVPPTTVPPTTTEAPTTLPPTTLPPPERGVVPVVVTSAGLNGERVGPTTYLLGVGGWADVRGVNGIVQLPATTIFYADGFQSSAEQMAVDMSLPVDRIAPKTEMPPVAGSESAVLVVYLGDT